MKSQSSHISPSSTGNSISQPKYRGLNMAIAGHNLTASFRAIPFKPLEMYDTHDSSDIVVFCVIKITTKYDLHFPSFFSPETVQIDR